MKKQQSKRIRAKKSNKKCKHVIRDSDPCPQCGYEEGECEKCGKWVCGNEEDGFEE